MRYYNRIDYNIVHIYTEEGIMETILQLHSIIKSTKNGKLVFFGGAGVSTESGIPDFRSVDGLYNQKYKFAPEVILSHDFFMSNTSDFYKYYFDKLIPPHSCKPNACHIGLSKLEKSGKLKSVITQNIDGFHQKAGSQNVYELHGSIHRNRCMTCHKFYNAQDLINLKNLSQDNIPRCSNGTCKGIIKPEVVLYQEPLDQVVMQKSISDIVQAQTLIVAGTSLSVYPAAGLVDYFRGENLIIINKTTTPQDKYANLCINLPVGEVFKQLENLQQKKKE